MLQTPLEYLSARFAQDNRELIARGLEHAFDLDAPECPCCNALGIGSLPRDQAEAACPEYIAEVDALPRGRDVPDQPRDLCWTCRVLRLHGTGPIARSLACAFQ